MIWHLRDYYVPERRRKIMTDQTTPRDELRKKLKGLNRPDKFDTDIIEAKTDDLIILIQAELKNQRESIRKQLHEIKMRATRHERATDEQEYLLRDLEFIADQITKILDNLEGGKK